MGFWDIGFISDINLDNNSIEHGQYLVGDGARERAENGMRFNFPGRAIDDVVSWESKEIFLALLYSQPTHHHPFHLVIYSIHINSLTQCQSKLLTSVISFKRLAEATPSWSRSERETIRQSSRSDAQDICTHWLFPMPRKPTNWLNRFHLVCNERTSKHTYAENYPVTYKMSWSRGYRCLLNKGICRYFLIYLVHSINGLTGARVCDTDGFVEWDVQRDMRTRLRKHHCGLVASYGRFDHGDMNLK